MRSKGPKEVTGLVRKLRHFSYFHVPVGVGVVGGGIHCFQGYSRTSMARTPMARLLWMSRTRS